MAFLGNGLVQSQSGSRTRIAKTVICGRRTTTRCSAFTSPVTTVVGQKLLTSAISTAVGAVGITVALVSAIRKKRALNFIETSRKARDELHQTMMSKVADALEASNELEIIEARARSEQPNEIEAGKLTAEMRILKHEILQYRLQIDGLINGMDELKEEAALAHQFLDNDFTREMEEVNRLRQTSSDLSVTIESLRLEEVKLNEECKMMEERTVAMEKDMLREQLWMTDFNAECLEKIAETQTELDKSNAAVSTLATHLSRRKERLANSSNELQKGLTAHQEAEEQLEQQVMVSRPKLVEKFDRIKVQRQELNNNVQAQIDLFKSLQSDNSEMISWLTNFYWIEKETWNKVRDLLDYDDLRANRFADLRRETTHYLNWEL